MIKKKYSQSAYKFRIGSNIRKWRNIKDIKQKELANSLKLSEAAVSNIENDITNITVTQLEDISIALNVSIEQLLSDPQEKFIVSKQPDAVSSNQEKVHPMENELVKALIDSLEKKDQQLHIMMQQFIHTMHNLMHPDKKPVTASSQAVARV